MTTTIGAGVTGRPPAEKESVPTVVFIGRLSANKRPDHAIRAFGYVRGQLPEAQMWVIGSGPEEARLRKMAGPGVTFFGRVSEEEKRQLLGRAHALVATSVREGWGLVVTEAAASGTVSIGYDVAGLRDSIGASGGVLTRPKPASLATGLTGLLSSVVAGGGPRAQPAGVVPWTEVAASILTVARQSESPATQVLDQGGSLAGDQAHGIRAISLVRVGLAVLGVALLLVLGDAHDLGPSPVLAGAAFLALLAATLIGSVEGLLTHRRFRSQPQAAARPTVRGAGSWPSRTGLVIVGFIAAIAAHSWFNPGGLLAGGDITPAVGTAWLGRLFAPWSWSGSDLGGPAADEYNVPFAAVYWLVHALGGSPALAQEIWYIAIFTGAAAAGYLFLRALHVGPAGSTFAALAYVFNAHVVVIGAQPLFLAAMALLAGYAAIVLTTASGRWTVRRGILLLGASAPLLGYVAENPPLVVMIGGFLAAMPLLALWLDGRAVARRALRTLVFGVPLLALASSYWLVPTLLQTKIDATTMLASPLSWTWAEGRATLANGFWLNNDWGWKYTEYFPYATQYAKFPLQTLKFLLPVAAFGFLALARFPRATGVTARRARLGVAAAATALFIVLLSTGTRPPGSLVFNLLYQLPLGWMLREPGRFLILGGLAYSVLLALTAEAARERLNSFQPGTMRRWRSAWQRPGLRLAAVGVAGAAVFAPGFPLMTGAVAPSHRSPLPSVHVSVPAYWTAMASYLNGSAPPGNLLVLPRDDFYQMPYTWGYYGADGFITNLISRNVVDPVTQGYTPAPPELTAAVRLVQQGLLAHDWPSVQRALTAIGTPMLLVRGDVNAAFPGRDITSPAALDQALREDKGMRLVHRAGKLDLFELRGRISPAGPVTSYATVNSVAPDLRDLALLPSGTPLISGPMRPAVRAVLQVPRVSQWRLAGDNLETSVTGPPGRRYRVRLLSATGALDRPGISVSRSRTLTAQVRHRDGQVVEELSYRLGRSLLRDGNFASGSWGVVGNCAAFTGLAAKARLAAHVLPGLGPVGQSALALSANAESACEMHPLAWRSGPLFVSLWVRNVSGAAPRMCLWESPINACALMAPLPSDSPDSRWYHYQTIVTPDPGTRNVKLYLYADAYTSGVRTTQDYSDVVVRRAPMALQPVVVATPRSRARSTPELYTASEGFSPDWTGPSGAPRVEVDGLRSGWLGSHARGDPVRYGPSSWYLGSRIVSLLAAGLLLALALSRWRGGRHRRATRGRAASGGRIHA